MWMWRDTGSPVRVLGCDYRVLFPLSLWALHMAWWTFYIALAGIVLFAGLERYGLTVTAFLRTVRRLLAGRHRPAVPAWKRRRFS